MSAINTKKDLHSACFRKREAEALSADAVSMFVLEPSRGRPLWTVTLGQPGQTVRREHSKCSWKQGIIPQAESRQARPTRCWAHLCRSDSEAFLHDCTVTGWNTLFGGSYLMHRAFIILLVRSIGTL